MERLPSGLIIPANGSILDYERNEVYFCSVCLSERRERGDGPLGFTKAEAEQYERHVVDCASRNEEHLRELSLRQKAPGVFGDEGWDVELEQWVRDNKTELIEDRKKL